MSETDRIRWRCRRGLLELDLILLKFFDTHYAQLSSAEQRNFEILLEWQDEDLLRMITSNDVAETRFRDLIARLRQC